MTPVLAAYEVGYSFGTCVALDRVTLRIHPGEIVALIGPNGAGKTTLVRLLAALIAPRSGRIDVAGPRTRTVAYLAQSEELPSEWYARDVVALGRLPHTGLWRRARPADREAIDRAMEQTGTTPFARRRISTLSGGERQRVAIARALAQEPRILLLDEPTSYLDVGRQAELLATLRSQASRGVATLAVMHDLGLARQTDRCVLLAAGTLCGDGPPADVLRPESLHAAYSTSTELGRWSAPGDEVASPRRAPPPAAPTKQMQ